MKEGRIVKVAGPLVIAEGMSDAKMFDVVKVSEKLLIGEIIELRGDKASIQVYEETGGLGPGEPVYTTGMPLSVELGPGLIGGIYDGIQRPLDEIEKLAGAYITRGINVPGLNREKKWEFVPTVKKGDKIIPGDILGTVDESVLVVHKIMLPPNYKGTYEIIEIKAGSFTVEKDIAIIKGEDGTIHNLQMMHRWPVRKPRSIKEKLAPYMPLITGQRVIDLFFPVGKGGTACVPGPFGSGKTVVQHQLAKWADAEIVVYVGCGERGNEMTDVLMEFPRLIDPHSGHPLMKRTVLVANTSNMPVAAREASVYTGITLAEYFRDMGYSVALMADSTSRWAEAMREMSGRLEEMPGEEGYPAYLGTRIAEFYERAGRVRCLGSDDREGALSVIGAVSPAGGDLSDAVVQATLRVVKVFWALEAKLAYKRHFPAIGWLSSYSLYHDNIEEYVKEHIGEEWITLRKKAMALLQKEAELEEIARLIGIDALSPKDRLVMEVSRSIREDFLHQNAFHPIDSYCSLEKQLLIMQLVMGWYQEAQKYLELGINIIKMVKMPIREDIARARYIPEDEMDKIKGLEQKVTEAFKNLEKE